MIRRDRITWAVSLGILMLALASALVGRALYQANVIDVEPMGTKTTVHIGPCTVQPLQLRWTCHTESGES